ncbi:hypothetical protein HC928_04840 [bacterium]|nr:hypothetical protein [bacterium]
MQEDKYRRNFYFFHENQDEEWMNSNPLSFIWESIFCFLAVAILFSILLLTGFLIGGLLLNLYISGGNSNLDWAFIAWFVWRLGLSIGLPIGFFAGFWLALFPVVRYFSLWFVLAKFNLIPFRYIKFLDYAVERKILQKIDGRYRFIHQLFLEYFADKESATESIL